jgi:hypothetical protein
MPSITGGIVVVGSRILMPVDLATVRAGFAMPVIGTVHFIGTIGTIETVLEIGTVELVITTGTVGTIVSGNITASVSSGVLDRVGQVGTVNLLDTVNRVGSISSGVVDQARFVGTVGTIVEGKVTASVSSGVVDQARYIGTVGTIVEGKVTASLSSGVVDLARYVGTIGVVGSLSTSGTLPVSVQGSVQAYIRDQIVYSTIVASLSPSTVSGTYVSPSVDALYYPGGVGFSIAYIGPSGVSATVLIQNSIDNVTYRNVATIPISPGGQYDYVYSPTRRYWMFTAVNPSTLSATIDAVIALLPPGGR